MAAAHLMVLLSLLPTLQAMNTMGEPISEIQIYASDVEFSDSLTEQPCWAVLFVKGEDAQLPSISLLEVLSTYPDMLGVRFGVADTGAVPEATAANGLAGLQTAQLMFFARGVASLPPVVLDDVQGNWAWLKERAVAERCDRAFDLKVEL